MTQVFLGASEFADRIGVRPNTLKRYKLPPADALIGATRGWLPETIDAWNETRPGRGFRSDMHDPALGKPVRKRRVVRAQMTQEEATWAREQAEQGLE